MNIQIGDLNATAVIHLLQEHLDDMYATSPADSVHALDLASLKAKDITFWTASSGRQLMGCIALKELNKEHAEIKSMRTANYARNKGVAKALVQHVIETAKTKQYKQLSLETGTMAYFTAARTLYERYGFTYCGPFADYPIDPNSCFMTLHLHESR